MQRDDAERLERVRHLGRVVIEDLRIAQAKVAALPRGAPASLFEEMALLGADAME